MGCIIHLTVVQFDIDDMSYVHTKWPRYLRCCKKQLVLQPHLDEEVSPQGKPPVFSILYASRVSCVRWPFDFSKMGMEGTPSASALAAQILYKR